jgi:hypothetical protein
VREKSRELEAWDKDRATIKRDMLKGQVVKFPLLIFCWRGFAIRANISLYQHHEYIV